MSLAGTTVLTAELSSTASSHTCLTHIQGGEDGLNCQGDSVVSRSIWGGGREERKWDLTNHSKLQSFRHDGRFLQYRDNGCLFEAGVDCRRVQGEVE